VQVIEPEIEKVPTAQEEQLAEVVIPEEDK